MANTTNFGWETPDDTDLVKDGAAAIRTLGSAIDASLADLEGGTTGQILSKTSNTDMDFTWITNDVGDITAVSAGTGISGGGTSGAITITNSMATEIAAKGDLIVGTGSATFDNLTAGTNNHRLVAASAEATGLKYVSDTVNTVIDAEGDLLVGDAADAVQRLAVGTTGQVLTVDTTVDGKIKWATAAASSGPTFLAYRATSTQSVSAGTYTKVQFNAESFDTDSCYDPSTNYRFTANKSGYYQVNICLNPYLNTANFSLLRLYFNGSSVRSYGNDATYGNSQPLPMSTLIYMNGSSDYIEVYLYTESSSNIDSAATNWANTFSAAWIRS